MSTPVRSYGGWRERRGFGVGTLTGRQTAAGLVVVVAILFALMVAPSATPVLLLPAGLSTLGVLVRIRGESLWAVAARHVRWVGKQRIGGTEYSAWVTQELPGPLAALQLVDSDGVGLIHDRRCQTLTAMVPLEPAGCEFAEDQQWLTWLQGWESWLSHLGYIDGLVQVAVTVDCAPARSRVVGAPGPTLVDQVMTELEALVSHEVRAVTLVSVTMRHHTDAPAVARILEVVASISRLNQCGVSVLAPWAPHDVLRWIRTRFDPSADPEMVCELPDARPTATQERWDSFRHDAAVSASFMWDESPGEHLGPQTLLRLFGPAAYGKRVCVVYEPVPAHRAAREVDRQAEAAVFRSQYRRRLGRDETARERLDIERARQTASEQARGTGLVDVGLYATVTATDDQSMASAAADVDHRAGECRIRLRRAYGTQLACFLATLGVGYVPDRSW